MLQTPPHNPYDSPATNASLVQESQVSPLSIDFLRRTRGWVLFLAILGYISCGFMLIAGLTIILGMNAVNEQIDSTLPISFAALGTIYILFALLYLYPASKLQKYARAIKLLIQSQATIDLETALNHQRGFWKFCGIFALFTILFYVIIFLFTMISAFQ